MVELKKLGSTKLKVSRIGLGTVEISQGYAFSGVGPISFDAAKKLILGAYDLGINFIDTAPRYGDGESERFIGRTIKRIRSKVVLCTKIEPRLADEKSDRKFNKLVEDSVVGSLKRLKTDYLDILKFHDPTVLDFKKGRLVKASERLVRAGKVRYIGASVYTVDEANEALKHKQIRILQMPYSIIDRRFEKALISANKKGVGTVARSVFFRGLLTSKILKKNIALEIQSRERAVESYKFIMRLVKKFELDGDDLAALAVQFVLDKKYIDSALVGTRKLSSVKDALDAASLDYSLMREVSKVRFSKNSNFLDFRGMFKQ